MAYRPQYSSLLGNYSGSSKKKSTPKRDRYNPTYTPTTTSSTNRSSTKKKAQNAPTMQTTRKARSSSSNKGGSYTVKSGDYLGKIASQYNTTVDAIAKANGISNPDRIYAGQNLRIPGASGGGSSTPSSSPTGPAPISNSEGSYGGSGSQNVSTPNYQERVKGVTQTSNDYEKKVNDYVSSIKEQYNNQASGPKLPEQINYDNYQTKAATIEDVAKKYGFDYSMDYAQTQAEALAQQQRDAIATQREQAKIQKESAESDIEHDFFQQFLAQQQEMANSGLNAGLENENNLRLQMSQKNALGDVLSQNQLRQQELDRQAGRVDTEAQRYAQELYDKRRQQGFNQAQQLTQFRQGENQAAYEAAVRARQTAVDERWREFEWNNMSASEKARLAQDAEQFGMEMAWQRHAFEAEMAMQDAYNQSMMNGNFNNGVGNSAGGGLGSLSRQYESGGRIDAIGNDRTGGKSYGAYQIATKTGTMNSFLNFVSKTAPAIGNVLRAVSPGTAAFDRAWKGLAKSNPQLFENIQHQFIKSTHYDPALTRIQQSTGINFSRYPKAIQDVIWSTAVQHGSAGANTIFKNAGVRPGMSPQEIINRVYNERAANGGRKYFGSSTSQVRNSVVNRFRNERQNALAMLGG